MVEARQLIGNAAQTMDVINWVRNEGYPWLIGNALEPETLVPEDGANVGKGVYIDPAEGDLFIRSSDGSRRASYNDWIILNPEGKFDIMHPIEFASMYTEA